MKRYPTYGNDTSDPFDWEPIVKLVAVIFGSIFLIFVAYQSYNFEPTPAPSQPHKTAEQIFNEDVGKIQQEVRKIEQQEKEEQTQRMYEILVEEEAKRKLNR